MTIVERAWVSRVAVLRDLCGVAAAQVCEYADLWHLMRQTSSHRGQLGAAHGFEDAEGGKFRGDHRFDWGDERLL